MDEVKLKSLFIYAQTTIKEAMQKLNETAEGILFVVDEKGGLCGTITDGDIRRAIIKGVELSDGIEAVMFKSFIFIEDGPEKREHAKKLMVLHKIEQIPVLNNDRVVQEVLLWSDLLGEDVRPSVAAVPDVPVIIMAGGKGTRLDPFTKILPKPLIPFQDKPIIEHIMDRFYASGFSRFMLIVNYKKEIIKMYFAENALPYEIQFIEEDDYYGTAGGLYLLESVIKNTFIMTNCDTLLQGDCSDFLKWHKDRNNLMTIVGSHREITVPYGVLKMNNGNLFTMIEKPKMDLFINTGTYVFDPDIFNYITERKVMNMDELINVVRVDQENRIGVYPHWGGWFDLGQWDEYNKSLKIIGGHLNEI